MPLIARKKAILAKIETTYGTDSVPTGAANAMVVRNFSWDPLEQVTVDREIVQVNLGASDTLIAAGYAACNFEVEMAGAGGAGTVPKYGPLLRACAMSETIAAGVDVQYKPVSASFESVSMYFYIDGVLHKMLGARGSVALRINRLGVPVFAFRFMGLYVAVTDAANPALTLTGWQKPLASNNTNTTGFTLHSASPVLDNLSVDLANQVEYRHLVGSESIIVVDRAPVGSVLFEAQTVAVKDWILVARTGTLAALSIVQGTTAGNKVQIDAPQVQVMRPKYSEQQGVQMMALDLGLKPSAGNDELVIKVL